MKKSILLSKELYWPSGSNKRVLPPSDAQLFHRLIDRLDEFVGNKLGIFKKVSKAKEPIELNELRKKIRTCWYDNPSLLDAFIQKEGRKLTDEEKHIILTWKNPIYGTFICVKYYAEFAIMASIEVKNQDRKEAYYAVLGITDDFRELLPISPPCIIDTGILPYKDVVIWDGLVIVYSLFIGKNMSFDIKESFKQYSKKNTIISNLSSDIT